MKTFSDVQSDNDIAEVIKSAFDMDLSISGAWGYTQESATVLSDSGISLDQLEHTIASMRAYIEMNMTLPKEKRYASINLNEKNREQFSDGALLYHKVTYEITAMEEDIYASFINEYKESYGSEDFDMNEHFSKRKTATLTRSVVHWFETHQI